MNVICLQEEALYELIETCAARLEKGRETAQAKWLSTDDALLLLGIKSKTTLQALRDEGEIAFTEPEP